MDVKQVQGPRGNALRRELTVSVATASGASPEEVFDLLADLSSHTLWAGERQKRNTRLVSIEGPAGPAAVGTEFRTTGRDPMGTFTDRSVVTEATRPTVLEFVTDAHLETKKGRSSDWTVIHRYELAPATDGCRIRYTVRITRVSELIGALAMFKVPGLRSLALKASAGVARRGIRNLAQLAEERVDIE
jgi:uncharacterized protein YndB with AHSA1/START domain